MTQCQIPRSTSVTDVLVDCETHVLTVIQTSPSGKESHQTVDLSCILPVTSKVTDVFYDCEAQQLVVTQVTDGVCAGGDCTETFVVSLACILDATMPDCGNLNSVSPLPVGSEIVICTPDGPKTTPPSEILPDLDCSNLPTACCPRPPNAMFFACNEGEIVLIPPNDLLTCEDFSLANPIPTDIHVLVCGGTDGGLVKVPSRELLNCAELPYLPTPDDTTLLIACTPTGVVKIDRSEGTGFPEAPIDGTPYERQDATWVPAGAAGVSIDAGNVTIIGSDGKIYTDALLQDEVVGGKNIQVDLTTDGGVLVNAQLPVSLRAQWHYDDVTGLAAPPVGYMHVDTTDLDTATMLLLNDIDWSNNNVGDGIKLIRPGDFLIMRNGTKEAIAVYAATEVAIDQTTYWEVPVQWLGGNSVNPDQDDLIDFVWFPASINQDLVGEAPQDGTPYERKDGQWVPAGDFLVIIQEGAPDVVTSRLGDEWWRPSDGVKSILHDDGVARQWIDIGEKGDTGPAGPAGPDGPIGPAGANGESRFDVVRKTTSFTASSAEGQNILYDVGDAVTITIPTMTGGGFVVGDVVTFSFEGTGTFDLVNVSVRTPVAKINAPFGLGAMVAVVYLSETTVQIYGDLADA